MATPSSTFTEMVSTTLRNWSGEVADNVSEHNALLRRLKDKGHIKTVSGGYEIQETLEYAENSTYQRYSGYDQLNVGASDVITSAKYDFQQVAIHITASGREINMNSSKEAMISLIKTRKKNAMNTARNNFSTDLYSDGTATNQINGLANLIQTDGNGTVGGIDASSFAFWQNAFKEMTGTDIAATPTEANSLSMRADMNDLYLDLVRGTDKPDMIVMSHDLFALYEVGMQERQRYTSSDSGDVGFVTTKYKGIDVIFDSDATNFATNAEKAYFLNCDYLYLAQHKNAKWTADEEKTPTNQDAVVIPIYWMGNLVCTNRALQGVLFDAA